METRLNSRLTVLSLPQLLIIQGTLALVLMGSPDNKVAQCLATL